MSGGFVERLRPQMTLPTSGNCFNFLISNLDVMSDSGLSTKIVLTNACAPWRRIGSRRVLIFFMQLGQALVCSLPIDVSMVSIGDDVLDSS